MTVHSSEYIVIKLKKEAVLQGWQDKSGLWKVTIKDKVENDNTDILLIYNPIPQDAIHNVYELASKEKLWDICIPHVVTLPNGYIRYVPLPRI